MKSLQRRWKNNRNEKDVFVGRDEHIKLFERLYETINEREITLLNFYGVGGIGKSTVLKQIKNRALRDDIPVFYYDLEKHSSVVKFYESLYVWLQENKIKSLYFQMAFLIYWRRLYPNLEFKESLPLAIQQSDLIGNILSPVVSDTLESVIPAVSGVSKLLYQTYKKLKIKYELDKDLLDQIGELEESDIDIEEIEYQLPYFFMNDLQRLDGSIAKMPLFLFDTYEKLYEAASIDKRKTMEAWVENFAASVQDRGMLVIAGREKIEWNKYDTVWESLIEYKKLDSFTYEETKRLILQKGIEDTSIVEAIATSSKGYPFYIELAIETYKTSPERFDVESFKDIGFEDIFKRFIGNLNNEYITILEYISVPRSFDKKLYAYITKEAGLGYSENIFNNIVSYSFFSHSDNQYKMHGIMQKSFEKQISVQQQKDIHKIVFEYYKKEIALDSAQSNVLNVGLLQESIYHLLKFASKDQISQWLNAIKNVLLNAGEYRVLSQLYIDTLSMVEANSLKVNLIIDLSLIYIDLDEYESLKSKLDELENMMVPIDLLDDVLYLRAKNHLFYVERKVDNKKRKSHYTGIKNDLKKVIVKSDTDELKMRAYIELSNILRKEEKFDEAIAYLYTALNLVKNEFFKAKIFDKLGFMYKDMKNYPLSKDFFVKAIEIKKGILDKNHIEIGKSYRGLSQILLKQNRIDEACSLKAEVIFYFQKLYGKWSNHVKMEYLTLAKHKDIEWMKQHNLDKELFLLAKLEIIYKKGIDYRSILAELDSLESEQEDMIVRYIRIASVLIDKEKISSDVRLYFSKALHLADSDVKKRQIYWKMYYIYRSNKYIDEAENTVVKILEISKNMDTQKYITDLQRGAYFYWKFKKDIEKADAIYKEAEKNLLAKTNLKEKLVEIYSYLHKLHKKDPELPYLYKELDVLKSIGDKYGQANVMLEIAGKKYGKKGDIGMFESLRSVLEIYRELGDKNRIDNIYGRLADWYKTNKEFEKALEYYYRQIELRKEIGDVVKLSKGYGFLANFMSDIMKNQDKAQEYYEKAFEVIYDNDKKNYELLEQSSYFLMKFYKRTKNFENLKNMIDIRVRLASESNITQFKIDAYRDLEIFFKKSNDLQSALNTLKETLAFVSQAKYPKQRLEILHRAIGYTEDKAYLDDHIKYMLECYQIYLSINDLEKAQEIFEKLMEKERFYNDKESFEGRYKGVFGNLLTHKKYAGYAQAIKHFKLYKPKERYRFVYDQIRRIKKRTDEDPDVFYKIYIRLDAINASIEAAIFYYAFFDLKLKNLKGEWEKQEELYIKSRDILRRLNNQKVTEEFRRRYEKFQERMKKMLIINGKVIDKVLSNVLERCQNEDCGEDIENRFKQYIRFCYEDKALMERANNNKLNLSVILQGIRVIDPTYTPMKYGFESNHLFVSWIVNATPLKVIRKKKYPNHMIVDRGFSAEDFEDVDDIVDYEAYVHSEENYAILLSKAFFDGNGVFFPKNKLLPQKVYKFLASASVIESTFDEIVELVCAKCEITDEVDMLRTQNLVRNIYYADIFLSENPYDEFENQKFTKKVDGIDLEKKLKQFGFKRLKELFSDAKEEIYNSLWI